MSDESLYSGGISQGPGFALENIFQQRENGAWKSRTRAAVMKIFREYFEPANLAKFVRVDFPLQDVEGEVVMTIFFRSIETSTVIDVSIPASRASEGPS